MMLLALQISKNHPTIWKKIFNESKTEDRSPSRSYDQMQIKNVFTAVNSATRVTRVNNLKFQIRGRSSITLACFGGSLNRGLNKLHNLNSFYSILPKLGQAIYIGGPIGIIYV
jgi:hypothetical protein